jgi:hydrogenase maturation protease
MSVRVLCLGNSLLADDAFGLLVADRLRDQEPQLEVAEASTSGFDLLDYTLGADRLLVVDTFKSGTVPPGTISVFREEDVPSVPGGSPHYVGLFEALRLGKGLRLPVPEDVTIIAVEPADCLTVGGPMHPAVQNAIAATLDLIREQSVMRPGAPNSASDTAPPPLTRNSRSSWVPD